MAAGEHEAYTNLWNRYDHMMVRAAHRLMGRLDFDQSDFDAEGAGNDALFEICRAANRGKLDTIKNSDGFWSYFSKILERVIFDAWDRQRSQKRGGPGHDRDANPRANQGREGDRPPAVPAFRRADVDLDQLPSLLPDAEASVVARQEFEALVDKLTSPLSRRALALKLQGHTSAEIGLHLNVSISTVEEMFREIRRTYFRHQMDRETDRFDRPPEEGPRPGWAIE